MTNDRTVRSKLTILTTLFNSVGSEILGVKMHHRENFYLVVMLSVFIPPHSTIAVKPDASMEQLEIEKDLIPKSGLTK